MDFRPLYLLVKNMALPPGLLVVVGVLGLVLLLRRPRVGAGLLGLTVALLWVLSAPLTSEIAARALESPRPVEAATLATSGAEAIVVLGGGARAAAPEYGGADYPMPLTLERLRYAAYLQRVSGLPLVTSGGRPSGLADSEAEIMRRVLEDEFHAKVAGTEEGSLDTAENATESRARLPYRRIAIVTHALHMPRAVHEFERAGFSVVPAPMGFVAHHDRPIRGFGLIDVMPTLQGLVETHYVVYEALGTLWYRWRYD
ncbi:MAG: YdcF family protein [Gammaproteobacteria bacterium]|nr:YdcF family protein [Gammaproteobacteria bacterium]